MHAISGLDIALWDIRGKLEGVSVSKLLGGAKRKRVETYASLLQYSGDVEHVKRNTARALERGYRHIKLHERTAEAVAASRDVGRARHPDHGRHQLRLDCRTRPTQPVAAMSAVQSVLGRGADLAAGGFRVAGEAAQGHRRAAGDGRERDRRARLPQDDRRRRDRFRAAVASSRSAASPICGRIATEAEKAGVTCVPHAFFFGPGYLATLHAIACKERDAPLERLFARRRLRRLCEDRAGRERRGRCARTGPASAPIRRRK